MDNKENYLNYSVPKTLERRESKETDENLEHFVDIKISAIDAEVIRFDKNGYDGLLKANGSVEISEKKFAEIKNNPTSKKN